VDYNFVADIMGLALFV